MAISDYKKRMEERLNEYKHNLDSGEDQSRILKQITAALEIKGDLELPPRERVEYENELKDAVEKRKQRLHEKTEGVYKYLHPFRTEKLKKELYSIERLSKYVKRQKL